MFDQHDMINPKYIKPVSDLVDKLTKDGIPFEVGYVFHGFTVVFPNFEQADGGVILHN